jgi:transposase
LPAVARELRKLLVHGARAALPSLLASPTPIGQWLQGLMARAHKNTVVVALTNKLAQIVWAVLRQGGTYRATAVKAT